MLANQSADATHRFQPFQALSWLKQLINQTNQKQLIPIEHDLSLYWSRDSTDQHLKSKLG